MFTVFMCIFSCGVGLQAEMERALLQGERRAELDQVEAELEIINQLQYKLSELDSATQREKDKVPVTLTVTVSCLPIFSSPVNPPASFCLIFCSMFSLVWFQP